jgi:hypothetical protein
MAAELRCFFEDTEFVLVREQPRKSRSDSADARSPAFGLGRRERRTIV